MRYFLLHLVFLITLVGPFSVHAAGRVLIRDAEIETMLKDWSEPIIRAAGLDPDSVKIILVQSPEANAFVAGGQNIFIYTGLLQKTENPAEVVGVIAHELGHIAGGHLVRGRAVMERSSYETMLGTLLGVGVAVATGSGEAGMAVIGGAQGLAQRNFLSFSRTQESAADQAGLRFMRNAGLPTDGLVTFMKKLVDQELLPPAQQNEYARTHPVSRDRVDMIESSASRNTTRVKPLPAAWADDHARMKAKLVGFTTPGQTIWIYPPSDLSLPARYARAIAAYRQNQVEPALTLTDTLIRDEPKNPYFHELKGQMLYDFGRASAAIAPYARAVALAPNQPLLKLAYAQALAEAPKATPGQTQRAITLLEEVRTAEPRNTRIYRLLATLYGRSGQDGTAQAMLAEEAFLQRRYPESRRFAETALKTLPDGARHRRMALDLIDQLDTQKKTGKSDK